MEQEDYKFEVSLSNKAKLQLKGRKREEKRNKVGGERDEKEEGEKTAMMMMMMMINDNAICRNSSQSINDQSQRINTQLPQSLV